MWKNTSSLISKVLSNTSFLAQEPLVKQQIRTTFILKRKYPAKLDKKGVPAKALRTKNFIYELIKDTSIEKQPDIEVILTSYVEGLGNPGERVTVKPNFAYGRLLLPGLAVYASPENVDKYKDHITGPSEEVRYSSPTALLMSRTLSQMTLSVVMNKEHPWTIQPWHIRTSFRKCGYVVPEDAIVLPELPIKGPDMNLEGKEFYVVVTINKTEKVNIRCRLHHWSTDIVERLPHIDHFWEQPSEPIHPEFQSVLNQIPQKPSRVVGNTL